MLDEEGDHVPHTLEYQIRVQKEMVEQAKAEGTFYGKVYLRGIDGYKLEQELRLLGSRFVHKELFEYQAKALDWSFTPLQKQYLFQIISIFHREYLRRNRRRLAMDALMDDLLDSIRERRNGKSGKVLNARLDLSQSGQG